MKKQYRKPRLFAESFELLEHISSCKANQNITSVTYRDGNACSYTDANVTLFNPDYAPTNGCTNEYYNDVDYDDFNDYIASYALGRGGCYNAFSDGNFFAS